MLSPPSRAVRTLRRLHIFERTFILSLLCILVHDILQQSGRDLSLVSGDGVSHPHAVLQITFRKLFPVVSVMVPLSLGLHLLLESVAGWHMFPVYLVLGSRTFLSPVVLPALLQAVVCWANILVVLVALVAGLIFPSPRLPRPSGPYDVGCVHYHWKRASDPFDERNSPGTRHIKILYPINPRRKQRSLLHRLSDCWRRRAPQRSSQRHPDGSLGQKLPYIHQPCSCHQQHMGGSESSKSGAEPPYRFARYCHEYLPGFLSRVFLHNHIQERASSNAWPGNHISETQRPASLDPDLRNKGSTMDEGPKSWWQTFLPIFDSPPEVQGNQAPDPMPVDGSPDLSLQAPEEPFLDAGALLSSQQLCYPVLLYCPDWDAQPENQTFLCESWVSRGFVVCVLQAPTPVTTDSLSPRSMIDERRECLFEAIKHIKHLNEHSELPDELRTCHDSGRFNSQCLHRRDGPEQKPCTLSQPGTALLDDVGYMMRKAGFRADDSGLESKTDPLSAGAAASAAAENNSSLGQAPYLGVPEEQEPQPRARLSPPTLLAQCMSRLGMLHQMQLLREAEQNLEKQQQQQQPRSRTNSRSGRTDTNRQKSKRKKSSAAPAATPDTETFDPNHFVQGFLGDDPMGGACTCCFNMFFGRLNVNSGVGLIGVGASALAALEISSVSQWFRDNGTSGIPGRRSSVCQKSAPAKVALDLAPEASCLPISCVVAVDPWIIPDSPMHHHVWQCQHTFPALFVCSEDWTLSHQPQQDLGSGPECRPSGREYLEQFCLHNNQPCYVVDYHGAKSLNFSDLPFLVKLNWFPRSFFSRIQSPDVQHSIHGAVDINRRLSAVGKTPPVITVWSLASLTNRFLLLYHGGSSVHGYQPPQGEGRDPSSTPSAWLPCWRSASSSSSPPPTGFPSLRPFSLVADDPISPRRPRGGKKARSVEQKRNNRATSLANPPSTICVSSDDTPPMKEPVQSAVMLLASNPLYSFKVYA